MEFTKPEYDDTCTFCGDDTVIKKFKNGVKCYYCGGETNFCSVCFGKFMEKARKIEDEFHGKPKGENT